jgi:hypothetical protein
MVSFLGKHVTAAFNKGFEFTDELGPLKVVHV